MFRILNEEFFGYDSELSENLLSINIMIDPQKFDLKTYKRAPFASVIVKLTDDELQKVTSYGMTRDYLSGLLESINNDRIYQYNLYRDKEYDTLSNKFGDRLFHTMIYFIDMTENKDPVNDPVIVVAGIPVKGMIAQIQKSNYHNVYNGALIQCKPFPFNDEYYNKILYFLVNIKCNFSFQEFKAEEDCEMGMMLDHQFSFSFITLYNPEGRWSSGELHENTEYCSIPIKGREDLFSKPMKNIFYLTDVPKDIMVGSSETLRVKL